MIKFIYLIMLLLLSQVACQSSSNSGSAPSWATAQQTQNYMTCIQKLTGPACASGQTTTCLNAMQAFISCVSCPQNNSSFSAFKTCVQGCGSTLIADPTTKNDNGVQPFVNGYNQCVAAAYSAIFELSTALLLIFSLIL
ncbi:hypothetical protein ABPG74_022216 [Tetrahymena malaccensis]